jgi:hypothetical protein
MVGRKRFLGRENSPTGWQTLAEGEGSGFVVVDSEKPRTLDGYFENLRREVNRQSIYSSPEVKKTVEELVQETQRTVLNAKEVGNALVIVRLHNSSKWDLLSPDIRSRFPGARSLDSSEIRSSQTLVDEHEAVEIIDRALGGSMEEIQQLHGWWSGSGGRAIEQNFYRTQIPDVYRARVRSQHETGVEIADLHRSTVTEFVVWSKQPIDDLAIIFGIDDRTSPNEIPKLVAETHDVDLIEDVREIRRGQVKK